jgi:hypothetical protein
VPPRGAGAGLAVPVRGRRLQCHVLDLNPKKKLPSTPDLPRNVTRNAQSFHVNLPRIDESQGLGHLNSIIYRRFQVGRSLTRTPGNEKWKSRLVPRTHLGGERLDGMPRAGRHSSADAGIDGVLVRGELLIGASGAREHLPPMRRCHSTRQAPPSTAQLTVTSESSSRRRNE